MDVARRLYLYLIAGITLALLVGALITLVNLALEILLGAPSPVFGGPRERLSLVISTIGVALPVWALHWGLAERSVRQAGERGAAERASAIRALFITIVLLGLLGVLATSGATLVRYGLTVALGGSGPRSLDVASALGSMLVAGAFWLYHVVVRWRDLRSPMSGAAAWLPRIYRYLAAYVGLVTLLYGVVRLVALAGDALEQAGPAVVAGGGVRPSVLVDVVTNIIVGAIVWAGHRWYAGRLIEAPDWRGPAERTALVRHLYFVLVIMLGVGVAITQIASALGSVLGVLFGATTDTPAAEVWRNIAGTLVIGLVFGGVWWAHRQTMIEQAGDFAAGYQMSARRTDAYVVAGLGLAFGAPWLALLIGLALYVAMNGQALAGGDWRQQVGSFAAFALVGSLVWIAQVATLQRWRRVNELAEARSTARRAYLLLAIASSLLVGLGALVFLLNRFIGTVLGVPSASLTSELATSASVLLVAVVVGGLHFSWLRRDQRVVADEVGDAAAAAEATAAEDEAKPRPADAQRRLVLTGPAGTDMAAALDGLRARLPEGYRLEEAG